jgi:hypothetical protein
VQFLYLANQQPNGSGLETLGENLLEAWVASSMAEPFELAAIEFAVPEPSAGLLSGAALLTLAGLARFARRSPP